MKRHTVFAIDPGMTTGYAWASVAERKAPSFELVKAAQQVKLNSKMKHAGHGHISCRNEIRGVERILKELSKINDIFGVDAVVIEDFILRGPIKTSKREGLAPVRITAMLEWQLEHEPFHGVIVKQQPSAAKGVIRNQRLKDWGLWIPGQEHARDAMRHLLLYLRNRSTS